MTKQLTSLGERTPRRDERGSGTILALGVALVLLGAGAVGVLWAAISVGSHRAASAADLAGLSAAQALQSGADPCKAAERIATNQRVELKRCEVEGEAVSVAVGVRLRLGALGTPTLTRAARAGPIGIP
jgi:secretion/DNA translocation related TadE-like protein